MEKFGSKHYSLIICREELKPDTLLIIRKTDPASTLSLYKSEAYELMELLSRVFEDEKN